MARRMWVLLAAGAFAVMAVIAWVSWLDPVAADRSTESAALRFPWEIDPPPPSLVPLDEIRSGGPAPDGIPPIDRPKFVSVASADTWIAGREPVLSLVHKGHARAYPLQILTWHEIVNDNVAGDPITVTFCPLCNSGIAFERRVTTTSDARELLRSDNIVLDFGTSGRLYRSNLVMYDRQTKSLWIQFTGQAVAGPMMRTKLRTLPVQIVSWDDFKRAHSAGRVLSKDTGNPRDYGRNPYAGYDAIDSTPFLFDDDPDGRFPPMERVLAVTIGDTSKAYRYRALQPRRGESSTIVHDTVGGRPIVIFFRRGTASALDRSDIAASKDVGATGVFSPTAGDRSLTFVAERGVFRDRQTGSTWNLFGEAVSGPLEGSRLDAVAHDDTFWFVWAAFRPDTLVWTD